MKRVLLVSLALLHSVCAQEAVTTDESAKEGANLAAKQKASTMTERITPAELAQRKAAAASSSSIANAKFKPVENKPSHVVAKPDLYATSEIITDGAYHTVLPKGSILGYTEELQKAVVERATGEFLFWPEFYAKNKDWLKLQEVDVATAKGEVPLSEAMIKSLQTEAKLTVAVYKGNPVTVLEHKEEGKTEAPKKK